MIQPSPFLSSITNQNGRRRRFLVWVLLLLAGLIPAGLAADPPAPDVRERAATTRQEGSAPKRHGALESLGAARWHEKGHFGKGFKIAILDSSFSGYRSLRGKTLPKKVTVKSFRKDASLEARGNTHGTQSAEVVHAIVPDAELLLVTWEPDSPQRFLEAIRWARDQGVRVFSCSVIIPSWSDGEGGGIVHRNLARLLGEGDGGHDVLFFASAGNTAQRHWSGQFKASSAGWHLWAPGQTWNRVTPWSDERVSVELACPADGLFELVVKDLRAGKEVGRGKRISGNDRFCLAVRFLPKEGHTYGVRVRQVNPSPSGFHLSILGGNLQRATRDGSIPFPGDGTRVLTVGAVDTEGKRQAYSSCGPNSLKPKPELVAVVPFPVDQRKEPFTGTSAAAPQAAAAAVLLWSLDLDQSANQVRAALLRNAKHLDGFQGHRYDTGFGLVRLPDLGKLAESEDSSE